MTWKWHYYWLVQTNMGERRAQHGSRISWPFGKRQCNAEQGIALPLGNWWTAPLSSVYSNAEWAIISSLPETSPPNTSDGDRILPTFVSRYSFADDHLVVDYCVRTLPLHHSLRKGEDTHQIFHLSGWLLCALFVHVSVFFVLAMMTRQTMRAGNG